MSRLLVLFFLAIFPCIVNATSLEETVLGKKREIIPGPAGQQFFRFYVIGDGDCGFHALKEKRKDILHLSKELINGDDNNTLVLLAPEAIDYWQYRVGRVNRSIDEINEKILQETNKLKDLKEEEAELKKIEIQMYEASLNKFLDKQKRYLKFKRDIDERGFLTKAEALNFLTFRYEVNPKLGYIPAAKYLGCLEKTPFEDGNPTGLMDLIAQKKNVNINVWRRPGPFDETNDQLVLMRHIVGSEDLQPRTYDLLLVGIHYERLVTSGYNQYQNEHEVLNLQEAIEQEEEWYKTTQQKEENLLLEKLQLIKDALDGKGDVSLEEISANMPEEEFFQLLALLNVEEEKDQVKEDKKNPKQEDLKQNLVTLVDGIKTESPTRIHFSNLGTKEIIVNQSWYYNPFIHDISTLNEGIYVLEWAESSKPTNTAILIVDNELPQQCALIHPTETTLKLNWFAKDVPLNIQLQTKEKKPVISGGWYYGGAWLAQIESGSYNLLFAASGKKYTTIPIDIP